MNRRATHNDGTKAREQARSDSSREDFLALTAPLPIVGFPIEDLIPADSRIIHLPSTGAASGWAEPVRPGAAGDPPVDCCIDCFYCFGPETD